MSRQTQEKDISVVLATAKQWIEYCLIEDKSILSPEALWTNELVNEVHHCFVDHPDFGERDFMSKLKGQMEPASSKAQMLMAEMLWALLLFPSNIRPATKSRQVQDIWALSGQQLTDKNSLLRPEVLSGIGSGGMGFNNYRPDELRFLIVLTRSLKSRDRPERQGILSDYDAFVDWIDKVPRDGHRQFRHMLRYFLFPDRVERISSNNDRIKILESFAVATSKEARSWPDRKLDDALFKLRAGLQTQNPEKILDFYEPPLKERWQSDRKVRTASGEVTVVVPSDDDEVDLPEQGRPAREVEPPEARESLKIQAKIAEIGIKMGFRIWIPRSDKARIRALLLEKQHEAFLADLPLNYNDATLDTIEQIDVLWLRNRSIVRAFEVEHTTAVYSGLLRMADLLALQPNMEIRLHIVAPDERREKVFREMQRPVFSLLDRGPLANTCTFLSYESTLAISRLEHLAHTNDSIIADYEERAIS